MTGGEHQSGRHLSETATASLPLSFSLSFSFSLLSTCEAGSLFLRVSPVFVLVYLASRLNRRLGGTHHRAAYVSGIHFSNEHERTGDVKVRGRQPQCIPAHSLGSFVYFLISRAPIYPALTLLSTFIGDVFS